MDDAPGLSAWNGARQAQLRRAQHLTGADLAEMVGVTKEAISAYELGRSQPSLKVAAAIAKALGVTVDELLA
jgi:transcriptional regulator with XRE-family HTH domain